MYLSKNVEALEKVMPELGGNFRQGWGRQIILSVMRETVEKSDRSI